MGSGRYPGFATSSTWAVFYRPRVHSPVATPKQCIRAWVLKREASRAFSPTPFLQGLAVQWVSMLHTAPQHPRRNGSGYCCGAGLASPEHPLPHGVTSGQNRLRSISSKFTPISRVAAEGNHTASNNKAHAFQGPLDMTSFGEVGRSRCVQTPQVRGGPHCFREHNPRALSPRSFTVADQIFPPRTTDGAEVWYVRSGKCGRGSDTPGPRGLAFMSQRTVPLSELLLCVPPAAAL